MAKSESELNKDVDALKADLAAIRNDLSHMATSLKKRGVSRAMAAKDDLESRVESTYNSMHDYVEERPMTTMLAAFGAGLVTGALLISRK